MNPRRKYTAILSASFAECSSEVNSWLGFSFLCFFENMCNGEPSLPSQAAVYGKCIVVHIDGIERGVCQKEYEQLGICMRAAIVSLSYFVYYPPF